LEELVADEELREKVGEYIEGEIVRSKREEEEEDEQAGIVGGDTHEAQRAESGAEADGVKAEAEAGEEGQGQEDTKDKKVNIVQYRLEVS
jgi:hypothetical protein